MRFVCTIPSLALQPLMAVAQHPHATTGVKLLDGLLAADRAPDAERLYREDLARFPENVWSLRGLQRSLVAQRKTKEAESVRVRLLAAEREQ